MQNINLRTFDNQYYIYLKMIHKVKT